MVEGIKTVELYKTNLVNTITNQHNDLKRIMTTSKQTLQMMIGILIGKEAEVQAEVQIETQDNSSLETVPCPKEPKKRSKKIDAKSK